MTSTLSAPASDPAVYSRRWWALAVLAISQLMIILDATIVNVALPAIQQDLGFSGPNLAWIVNGYTLAFGGFLLLGGRLADRLGRRLARTLDRRPPGVTGD